MGLGSSASDLGLVVLLLVPGLLLPLLLFALIALLGRALRLPPLLALLLGLGLLAGLLAGASLWLDGAGRVVTGIVERHDETVELRSQGDWLHRFSVSVRYTPDGAAPLSGQTSPDESAAALRLSPAQFDRLSAGEPAELRVLPLFRSLALVRLADSDTLQELPWTILAIVGGGLAALWLASLLFRTTIGGIAVLVMAASLGVATPLTLAYQRGQAADNLAARPLRATAMVVEAARIAEVDPFPCRSGSGSNCGRRSTSYAVAQPYQIVQLRFTPQGAAGEVIAVDAIDAVDSGGLRPGASVEIAYASASPRAATILGAARSHYWRNAVGLALVFSGIALALSTLLFWALRRGRKPVTGSP